VYVSDRSGTPELWISDANGSNSRQLTSLGGPRLGAPRWAPDGEYIAFAAWQGGSADIYTVHGAGGAPAPVTADPAEDLWPSWSRDGRWIYFASNRSGDWQVWKKPTEGGNATQVTQNGGGAAMESHDGRLLYFTKGQGTAALWEMPLKQAARLGSRPEPQPDSASKPHPNTGPELQPDSGPEPQPGEERLLAENLFGTANFYVSREGVYFVARQEGSAASSLEPISPPRDQTPCPQEESRAGAASCGYVLQFLRFSTGKIERVTTIRQPTDFGLTVSADGRRLLYPQWDEFEADLILQELPE
jgi:dipeptidyl aminopeptidase/acylaminoacyl peptidase